MYGHDRFLVCYRPLALKTQNAKRPGAAARGSQEVALPVQAFVWCVLLISSATSARVRVAVRADLPSDQRNLGCAAGRGHAILLARAKTQKTPLCRSRCVAGSPHREGAKSES